MHQRLVLEISAICSFLSQLSFLRSFQSVFGSVVLDQYPLHSATQKNWESYRPQCLVFYGWKH
jgi:hypothetical protein